MPRVFAGQPLEVGTVVRAIDSVRPTFAGRPLGVRQLALTKKIKHEGDLIIFSRHEHCQGRRKIAAV